MDSVDIYAGIIVTMLDIIGFAIGDVRIAVITDNILLLHIMFQLMMNKERGKEVFSAFFIFATMRFFNRHFFIGMISGIILSIAVFLIWGHFFFLAMPENPEQMESSLFPPQFPDHSKLSIQGKADDTWSFKTLDGKETRFSEFRNKVLFINFWATWCIPCLAEMKSLQNLYDSFKIENVQFLMVSNEDEKTVREFLEKKQFTFPVYLAKDALPQIFKSEGIPATFILNRDGAVIFKHIGAAKWDEKSCVDFIHKLL